MCRFGDAAHEEVKTRFYDESMVASIKRPTLVLYRKSREVYGNTAYDKLI